MRTRWGLVGMVIFWGMLFQESAWTETMAPEAVELEPVVVTATGTDVPLKRSTQSVTVITEKEVQERQAVRVEEMLRYVPGVTVSQSGSQGGTTSLFLRGGNANQTQVLFNGIQMNDAGGDFDYNALTTDNLSRIEVVRGPMSAMYGADAMVGVVNIMTQKGAGPPTLNLAAGAGPHVENGWLREEYRASLLGSYKTFSYSFGYSHVFDPGILSLNNKFRNDTIVARLDWDPLENLSLTYYSYMLTSFFGFPTVNGGDLLDRRSVGGPGLDPNQNSTKQDTVQGLTVNYWPFPWWQNQLTLGLSVRNRHLDNPANPTATDIDALFGSFNSQNLERRYSLNYLSNFRHGSPDKVESIATLGFYAREENLKQWIWTGQGLFATTTNTFLGTRRGATAYYAQEQLNFKKRLSLVGGFRVENSSVFDAPQFIPRGSASLYFPETNTVLRAGGGKAIKEPTFLESFSRSQTSKANPNLKPERNTSWEVGLDQYFFHNNCQISVTYFENYFTDLITFVPRPFPQLSSFENIGAVRIAGLESAVRVSPVKGLTLGLVYTNLFTRVTDDGGVNSLFFQSGKPLLRRPRNTFSFVLNYARDRLNLNLTGLYTGWRDDTRFTFTAPFFFNSARVTNSDNFVLNFTGTYDLVRHWGYANTVQLWVRLNNLLDERYQEVYGYSSPRFSMLGGVRVIFGLKPDSGDKKKTAQALMPPLRSKFAPGFSANVAEGNRI
uniref:TonB-dependent receptor n=1 Tax=Desulfobacca acetoxidans TaxID=60893 RepID=A0A7C3UX65_9BACT